MQLPTELNKSNNFLPKVLKFAIIVKVMKKLFVLLLFVAAILFASAEPADAAVRVRGYYRSNGTYVQPHYRSNPDRLRYNNYSSRGNYNPYTGARGYRNYWRW